MKNLLPIILLMTVQVQNLWCQGQPDVYEEGMTECVGEENFKTLSAIFREIDSKILVVANNSKNPYLDFSMKFCNEEIENGFFKIEKKSKLDSLIKKALKGKFWRIDEEVDISEPVIIDGQEVEIIPPGGKLPKPNPESIEKIRLNHESKFISCSRIFALNKTISTYYNLYERLGIASSTVKICGLYEIFEKEDFNLYSVKYFITIDVVLQKMLHQNKYIEFLKE